MKSEHALPLDPSAEPVARKGSSSVACGRIPLSFRLAKTLIREDIRGGYRLLDIIRQRGWLDRVVRYKLSNQVAIDVPLFREDNCFDAAEVNNYESHLMEMLGAIVPKLAGPVKLIDGGADIGLFSMRLVARHPNITSIHALEPNEEAYEWLCRNLNMLPIACHPMCAAVGAISGRGELRSPDYDPSDHGKYIAQCDQGTVSIVRIDDLDVAAARHSLVLKLDVEGAEVAAIDGAQVTIAQANQVVVALEAHPRVAARTGIDPVDCLRLLSSLRRFEFHVAECPGALLSTDRGVFDQLDPGRCCNIVAVSLDPQGGGR